MKVRYYLCRPNIDAETSIYARISYSGNRLKYYIPESIHPKNWNKEKQRARESKKWIEYPEFNKRLDDIQAEIKNNIRWYINNHKKDPTVEALRSLLDNNLFKKVDTSKPTLRSYFKEFIEHSRAGTRLNPKTKKRISPGTITTYENANNAFIEFQKDTGYRFDFDTVNMEFYKRFLSWCYGKNYKANYIGKLLKKLKTVLTEATEEGINDNLDFQKKGFASLQEAVDNIALTEFERQAFADIDLTAAPHLDRVRDRFIIGCYSGLRYSDYSILDPSKIRDGLITVEQTKTGHKIVIPIHPIVLGIIDKYNGGLPPALSNQKTNEYLKEIARKIDSLQKYEDIKSTAGGVTAIEKTQRCEMVSTHTARRTFATLEYLAGTPALTIMAITGHKTEKDFLKYIKVSSNEHAEALQELWTKRSTLQLENKKLTNDKEK